MGDEAFEIAEEVAPREGEKVFVKTINSCFENRDFAAYPEEANDPALMIVGLQTDFCIDATVKSAFERGYHMIVPEGTNSTCDNPWERPYEEAMSVLDPHDVSNKMWAGSVASGQRRQKAAFYPDDR